MSDSNSNSGGTSIVGLLGVAFVVLKLTGHIDWSWWFVTMPFWGGAALGLAVLTGFGLMWGAGAGVKALVLDGPQERAMKKLAEARRLETLKLADPYMQEGLAEVERICS